MDPEVVERRFRCPPKPDDVHRIKSQDHFRPLLVHRTSRQVRRRHLYLFASSLSSTYYLKLWLCLCHPIHSNNNIIHLLIIFSLHYKYLLSLPLQEAAATTVANWWSSRRSPTSPVMRTRTKSKLNTVN